MDITSRLVRSLRAKKASQLPTLAGAPSLAKRPLTEWALPLTILIESRANGK
jgi:hypothetical protein